MGAAKCRRRVCGRFIDWTPSIKPRKFLFREEKIVKIKYRMRKIKTKITIMFVHRVHIIL